MYFKERKKVGETEMENSIKTRSICTRIVIENNTQVQYNVL